MDRLVRNIGALLLLLAVSCSKQGELDVSISAEVNDATLGANTASVDVILSGVTDDISYKGIVYGTDTLPTIGARFSEAILSNSESNSFTIDLTDLEDNGYYNYRGFAVIDGFAYYSEVEQFATDCPGLGRGPAGGYIIYSDGMGGGIEVAPYDILIGDGTEYYGYPYYSYYKSTFVWGCNESLLAGANSSAVGDGAANTLDILAGCSEDEAAARVASNYSFNGIEDWYLPNNGELDLMHDILFVNGYGKFQTTGGSYPYYYSSTQSNSFQAYAMDFSNDVLHVVNKSATYHVRPIRTF